MSKRTQALKESLTEDKNGSRTISKTSKGDSKFIARKITELEHAVEDAEDTLESRLGSVEVIDSSTVEVDYFNLLQAKEKLDMYKDFQEEYL